MKKLIKLWEAISNIGITNDILYSEQIKIRVVNQVVAIVIPIQLMNTIYLLFNSEFAGVIIGLCFSFFTFGLLMLNKYQKFNLAQILLNTIFPLLILGIGVSCGKVSEIHYNFIIFVVAAFFFHNEKYLKFTLGLYNIILYFILKHYWENYTSPYSEIIPPSFGSISFVITIITIIAMIQRFILEISRVNTDNQALLKNLESNNQALKSANEALERFAYVASHDLKTPLRTILGFAELLEKDYKNNKTERFPIYLSQVKQGARQMNELIKNTLEYSRISHMTEEKKWIDLNEIIATIHIAYATDKSVKISPSTLPKILSEENQVLSLFQNLIENGIKYNDKPLKIIEINHSETPYSIQITVKDNGIGISKKFHAQIFTMFKRLHTNQKYEGTGLGLAICEKIVDNMNGQISLTSVEGEGTTFYIDLPKI